MKFVFDALGWIGGSGFLLLFALSVYCRHYVPSALVLAVAALLIPPIPDWVKRALGIPLPSWLRALLVPALLFLFVFLIFRSMGNEASIYKNPGIERRLMEIYDARMDRWPVPREQRLIATRYGNVSVVISGPEDAPPVFLLHASAMASWSWLYNVEGLNRYYRTYAVDTIGDAGKSVLTDVSFFPKDGAALAALYAGLMDELGVRKACFIGASQGGFIATNIALHAPERVTKIVLCGPMGIAGTNASVLRILFTTMFPAKPLQRSATRWAFGDDPAVNEAVGEWFGLILDGVISRQARPRPFSRDELRSLDVPVLLLLGKRDGLVGDPEKARRAAKEINDLRVRILDTGHLISAERPDEFNELVTGFLGRPAD